MNDVISISSQKPLNSAFDYEELRKIGVEHLEKTASAIWTDYNVHDPGITTLELLCYAITDLSYRANNSIPDLLATPTNAKTNILKHFFSASNIFPNNPVTINDYRKLIIDIVGVKNAWLTKRVIPAFADISNKKLSFTQPQSLQWENVDFKGYYDILLEFDTNITDEGKLKIKDDVRSDLLQNRNLCEDFLDIKEVTKQEFRLCTELELKSGADPFDTVARIFYNIQLYLTPLIRFYWLRDLVTQGYTSDVIFEGPLLVHGFIKEDELIASNLKTEVHLSDVMQQVLNVDGVINILDIVLNQKDEIIGQLPNKWIIPVTNGTQPVLNILDSNILTYKNGIPLRPDLNIVKSRFEKLMSDHILGNDLVRTEDIDFETGVFRDVGNYFSIQNHYPKNYGISHWGLPEDSPNERKAQAKQLQGYLYFFDQQLANYLSELSHLRNLFSTDNETETYFTQVVRSFKDADQLFTDELTIDSAIQAAAEDKSSFYRRRNLFLDHLLSRFAESFFDYVNVIYSGFTSNPKDVISPSVTNPEDIILDKVNFLKQYPEYSAKRFTGYNSQAPEIWDTDNISGLEKRLQRLLGINNLNRRNLVSLQTIVQTGLDDFNNEEFWFRVIDYRSGEILLEGIEKFVSREEAAFELDDALTLVYSPQNLKVIENGTDHTFSYQLLRSDVVIATSTRTFPSLADANSDLNHLVLLVTKERSDEGLFLIEHLLLLPKQIGEAPGSPPDSPPESPPASPPEHYDAFLPICVDSNCKDCEDKDPYSFRISVVLPAFAPRFLNLGFRQYCERVIRMEAPAHTFVKICWVSNEQLVEFEEAYKDWLEVRSGLKDDTHNVILNRFITILTALKSIYPVARLEDCKSSEERTLFLLNQNSLGTLKT